MLVRNDHAVNILAALLGVLHVLDRLHARGLGAGTDAKFVADLQCFDLGQHLGHAGFRLENHLETVELEAAVVLSRDIGELDDFIMLGKSARCAGVNRRAAARAGGKTDGAKLHTFAHHRFHRLQSLPGWRRAGKRLRP